MNNQDLKERYYVVPSLNMIGKYYLDKNFVVIPSSMPKPNISQTQGFKAGFLSIEACRIYIKRMVNKQYKSNPNRKTQKEKVKL